MRLWFSILAILVIASSIFLFFPSSNEEKLSDSSLSRLEEGSIANHELDSLSDSSLKKEAEEYIQTLSETNQTPLKADEANDFISSEQIITLGNKPEIEETTIRELLDSGFPEKAPVTVIREEDEIVFKTPLQILHDAKNNPEGRLRIMDEEKIIETTVKDILEQHPVNEITNIAVVEKVENFIITTPEELKADTGDEENIRLIRKPYALEATSIGELLMGETETRADNIYYVRNINASDQNGIWGIIQSGLAKNFAAGIAIKRGESIEKYQVSIPENADERLEDKSSSFLGQIIQKKTRKSYVYNFENGKMGRNPDLIYPGQELIIISFKPDELIEIYQHFVTSAIN